MFLLACGSTLTIWNTGPLADRIYECSVLSLAAWILLQRSTRLPWRLSLALSALALWGFLQLAVGATVYFYATLQCALRISALCATALIAHQMLGATVLRERFLLALSWFGFLVSVVSVVAYYTSPIQVLWTFDAAYPDIWGPFLSRNNFAQFLELTLPVALWLALQRRHPLLFWAMSASMLAAGLASASRAGAVLLCLETVGAFLLAPRRNGRAVPIFLVSVVAFAAIAGAGTLLGRLRASPVDERSQIYRSTLGMISQRPLQGYGLGTFASVYPEFARFDSGYAIEYAHNDWLEWTAEGGMAYTAFWALLTIPAAKTALRHSWGLGIPAVFLHALVDFPLARFGIAAWVFILLGALERSSLDGTGHTQFRRTT